MGLLDWLFGRKEPPVTAAGHKKRETAMAEKPRTASGGGSQGRTAPSLAEEGRPSGGGRGQEPRPAEGENLRRWRQSGGPRSWVESRHGQWGHAEWLALLDELRRSPFWPMHPDEVGAVLEEHKREWLGRN